MILADIASNVAQYVQSADSDDDGGGGGLIFLLLSAGPIFYGLMFARYRNTDKRHRHESETKAELANLQYSDTFAQSLTGLKHRTIQGANNHSVDGALNQGGLTGSLSDVTRNLGALSAQMRTQAEQSRRRDEV